ncbi:MAG: hypothetical protein WAT93_01600 [Pontixanthobacter sp.]
MDNLIDPTAWTALLLGAFTLFAAIGALRKPGVWRTMVAEIEKSPALQLVSGMLELFAGAVIYLANPWIPADILTCLMKALGALMMVEALAVIGFSDIYFHFWLRNLAHMRRGWPMVTFMLGAALTIAAMFRL